MKPTREELIALLRQLQANFDEDNCIDFAYAAMYQIDDMLDREDEEL